jgi:hypothetical protein
MDSSASSAFEHDDHTDPVYAQYGLHGGMNGFDADTFYTNPRADTCTTIDPALLTLNSMPGEISSNTMPMQAL